MSEQVGWKHHEPQIGVVSVMKPAVVDPEFGEAVPAPGCQIPYGHTDRCDLHSS